MAADTRADVNNVARKLLDVRKASFHSMDRAVETIIRENKGKIGPGDSYLINAPYNGGTHIPDLTVCTPVFDRAQKKMLFWVASRGHHADIGGIAPGSMSPIATNIEEEGIYIDNFKLVDRGKFREQALMDLLTRAQYPARNPIQNVNDLTNYTTGRRWIGMLVRVDNVTVVDDPYTSMSGHTSVAPNRG